MSSIQAKIDVLTPGSVWSRTSRTSASSTETMVLFVSNLELKDHIKEVYPPQVVFLTAKGNVLTLPVEEFLETRRYVGTNENLASELADLVENAWHDKKDAESPFDTEVATTGAADEGIPVFEPAVFRGLPLDEHFLSYSEAPFNGDTMHTLRFMLSPELSMADLRDTFTSMELSDFVIDTEEVRQEISVTSAFPVFMEASDGSAVGVVYLVSDGYAHPSLELDLSVGAVVPASAQEVSAETAQQPTQQAPVQQPQQAPVQVTAQPNLHVIPQVTNHQQPIQVVTPS